MQEKAFRSPPSPSLSPKGERNLRDEEDGDKTLKMP